MSAPAIPLPPGPITRSLDDIARLLHVDTKAAAAEAREFLKQYPGQRQALALLVSAHRLAGDLSGARAALLEMAEAHSALAAVQYELGLLLKETGERENAIIALSRAAALEPRHAQVWRALADALADSGNAAEANKAYAKRIELAATRLRQLEAGASGEPGRLPRVEQMLRARLARDPTDLPALALLGSVYIRLGRYTDAQKPLLRALKLAPEFAAARNLLRLLPAALAGKGLR
jgi:tetratricopeptide (TPR) repeat protein